MSFVALPADRRFRRAHIRPARRRKWRALAWPFTKYVLLVGLTAYGLYRGGVVAADAGVLQIDRIVVHGNHRLSSGEVMAILVGLRGESLMWSDLDAWRERLLSSPWVKDAALRRSLPSTVDIALLERVPIGIGRLNGGLYLVDDQGLVIDEYGPQYADLDLPIIDGLSRASGALRIAADPSKAELAARLLSSLAATPEVAKRLSQVDVSDRHNAMVILNGDSAVIYLGEDRFLPRLRTYLELETALRARVPDIDYADLRFDDRIYVRPAGKAARRGTIAVTK